MKNLNKVSRRLTNLLAFFAMLLILFSTKAINAQTPQTVNVTVNITPPYSPFYADYSSTNASKVLLLVQNLTATTKTIKLTGQLTGDNGIRITTKSNYVPLQPIILNPNETKQLNGLALKDIFDLNALNVYGIDKSRLIYTSRLPEGNYTFCIQAVDMATNQVISSNAPLGCTSISILYPDAPFLINPLSNSTMPDMGVTPFAWGNNVILPMGIEYTLQVAEMPAVRMDPNQVLNATSFPLITKTILSSTSTVLLPTDPPLTKGKRYAWRVIAKDPRGLVVFKNNGISKANEFRYGESLPFVASILTLNTPEINRGIEDFKELVFNWKFIDNSAQNDNVGFYDGPMRLKSGLSFLPNASSKYELHIIKIKTEQEKRTEQRNRIGNVKSNTLNTADKGIIIPLDNETIDYNSSKEIASYVKDDNSYEWFVKQVKTGTVSETRTFTMRVQSAKNKTISLVGNLYYNFYDKFIGGASNRASLAKEIADRATKTEKTKIQDTSAFKTNLTDAEKGFPLANKNIQILKVRMLAPTYRISHSFKVKINGVDVVKTVELDSIAPLSDLIKTYSVGVAPKSSNTELIASGTTDNTGNFKIDVPIGENQYKVIDSNVVWQGKKFALVEGLVIRVNDNRFSDPNWFVVPESASGVVALGESTVEIFGYKLETSFASKINKAEKGKLYLLRKIDNLIKGEVQNTTGAKKNVPLYTTEKLTIGSIITQSGSDSYNVVGVTDIDIPGVIRGNSVVLNKPFSNLVTSLNNSDDYTLYYEPNAENDGASFSPIKISHIGGKLVNYESTTWAIRNVVEKASFKPKFISMQVRGRYTYTWAQPGDSKNTKPLPLPEGTTLKLVKGNLKRNIGGSGLTFTNQKFITSTTVKKNGEYTFDIGIQNYDDFNQSPDLVIVVDSKYYFSQANLVLNNNDSKNIVEPDLNATVRQFTYSNRVGYLDKSDPKTQTAFKKGLQVYLCREITGNNPLDRPKDDGNPDKTTWLKKIYELKDKERNVIGKYEIVDKTISGDGGVFNFNRLVVPASSNESYHVFAEPMSSSPENFESIQDYVVNSYTNGDGFTKERKGTFIPEQKITAMVHGMDLATMILTGNSYVSVEPMSPYIDGAVYPNSNTSTSVLTKVLVEMFDMPVGSSATLTDVQYDILVAGKTPRTYITDNNGRFLFDRITVKGDKFTFFGKGYTAGEQGWKLLRFTKQGFIPKYTVVNSGKPLPKGSRGNLQKVFMDLPKDIFVTVKNSEGVKIPARIIVGNDFSWMDYSPDFSSYKNIAKTPKNNVSFEVIPIDRSKYKTTTVTKFITDNTSTLDFVVNNMEHSVIVNCYKEGTNTLLSANVTVLNTSKFTVKYIPNFLGRGPANLVNIPAGGTQFDLKVVPTDINYTIGKTQIHSNGIDVVTVNVYVKPAIKLTVTATQEYMKYVKMGMFGSFQSATEKATDYKVFIKELKEDEYLFEEGYSYMAAVLVRAGGTRVISRIPSTLAIDVSVTKDGYIGESKVCFPWGQSMARSFNLTLAPNMNVKSIYGFPIELTKASKQPNGQYVISGRLNPDVPSGNLTVKSKSDQLEFKNVFVNVNNAPSGLEKERYFTLANGITFTQNSIDAKLFNNFDVKIMSANGLSLQPKTDKTGSIAGKVAIDPSSFAKGVTTSYSDVEGDGNYLYLNELGKNYSSTFTLPAQKTSSSFYTFSTAKSDFDALSYIVSSKSGYLPSFQGADGMYVVPDKEVKLGSTALMFAGTVNSNLKNTATPNIKAQGTFVINKDNFYVVAQQKFAIKLRNWDLNITSWNYGTTGFRSNGTLSTQGLTIPFTDLDLTYDKIGFGVFDVKALKLLNTFPVTLNGNQVSVSFGYDKGFSNTSGAWSVSVLSNTANNYIAGIKGLEDLEPTDEIKIKNISLYDTGDANDTRILLAEDQAPVTLNGIAKYRPGVMSGTSDFVSFRGDLSMDIPGFTGLEAVTYDLKYVKDPTKPNGLRHEHDTPFQKLGLDTKGILVSFDNNNQKFTKGTLELFGTLTDKDPNGKDQYNIPVKLTKTKEGTSLDVIPQSNGEKSIFLNKADHSTYLADAYGSTKVINNNSQWEYFTFGGNLISGEGVKPSPMTFTIKGEIVVNKSELGIKNMGDSMNGFSIVYDFKEKALLGSGHINQKMSFASLDLDAELKIGNAADWYIFASGKASVDNVPILKNIGVAFMVGNTIISDSQRSGFYKHFGGNITPSNETLSAFQGRLTGIMFMVSTELKIPLVPTFNLDLDPVAHCDFTNGVYAAAYFKLNFTEGAEITVGGRVGAYVQIGAGASIGLACAGISLRAETNAEISAKLNPIDKTFAASLALNFQFLGSAYVGVGVCNSNCETVCAKIPLVGKVCSPIKCYKNYYSKKLSMGVAASLSNSGISLSGSGPKVEEN